MLIRLLPLCTTVATLLDGFDLAMFNQTSRRARSCIDVFLPGTYSYSIQEMVLIGFEQGLAFWGCSQK